MFPSLPSLAARRSPTSRLFKSLGIAGALILSAAPEAFSIRGDGFHCRIEGTVSIVGQPNTFSAVGCKPDEGVPATAFRFSWDFGDSSAPIALGPEAQASHTFKEPGHYTILLKVTDGAETAFLNLLHAVIHPSTAGRATASGPMAHDIRRKRVFVVNPDHGTVTAIDALRFTRIFEKASGKNPRNLALDSLGRVWVTNQDDATVSVLDGEDGRLLHSIPFPRASRPFGIVMDPLGRWAYVTLEATGELVRLDIKTVSVISRIAICPTPRPLAVSHDGKRILAGRFHSGQTQGQVVEVDADAFQPAKTFTLDINPGPDNESAGRGVPNLISALAISPDGRRVFAAAKKDNTQRGLARDGLLPTFDNTVRAILARIDLVANGEKTSDRWDIDNRSILSAMAFTRNGEYLFVSSQGTNATEVRDAYTGDQVTAIEPKELEAELAPQGLVLDEKDSLLFIHYFTSREVAVYDVSSVGKTNEISRLALIRTTDKEVLDAAVLKGKQIFNNAADRRMAKDGYMSCGTCHPEGGTDGRVYDFTDRGEGLRRTTTLLGKAGMGHGPVHWSANFDEIQDFEHDIRGPFGGSGFLDSATFHQGTRHQTLGDKKAGLSPDLDALAAYVASLDKVHPSPFRKPDGSMTEEALKGKAIFNREEVGCAKCHSGPHFTDSDLAAQASGKPLLHDVGTLKKTSGKRLNAELKGLDTPTLKGVWEGGPYLHDGSAASLMEVLVQTNPADKHGKTSHLTATEREQLVAYLMQLDDSETTGSRIRKSTINAYVNPILSVRPTRDGLRIRFQGPASDNILGLSVHDFQGRTVAHFPLGGFKTQGKSGQSIHLSWPGTVTGKESIPAGRYMLKTLPVRGKSHTVPFQIGDK